MKRRKRSSSKRRRKSNPARVRHIYHKAPKRRRVKRNPVTVKGIMNILIDGALAGVGAIALLYVSDIVAEKFLSAPASATDAASKAKRNIATLAIAVLGGWAAQKFIKGEKGKAVATGMVTGSVMRIAANMFNVKMALGGDQNTSNMFPLSGFSMASTATPFLHGYSTKAVDMPFSFDDDGSDYL